jgi:hypothetical protein
LLQQVKSLEAEQPKLGNEVARELTSIKHSSEEGRSALLAFGNCVDLSPLRKLPSIPFAYSFHRH